MEWKGYAGQILRVDLSARRVVSEPLLPEAALNFVAGRGFGIKYLYDELPAHTDPLGQHNKLSACCRNSEWHSGAERVALGGLHQESANGLLGPGKLRGGLWRLNKVRRIRFHLGGRCSGETGRSSRNAGTARRSETLPRSGEWIRRKPKVGWARRAMAKSSVRPALVPPPRTLSSTLPSSAAEEPPAVAG